tara:strand:+ start:9275 stop:10444 length:1170 start_codon:yes stop_codon:yes gene_type:complete
MSIYKFDEKEIFVNSLRLYPKYEFAMHSGTVFINNEKADSGSFSGQSLNVPSGFISLHEINIDKLSGSNNFIYPFITKDGSLQSFATVSTTQFAQSFAYGDVITGSYPMSSSLHRKYYSTSATRPHIKALENTLNHYKKLSPHYEYSSSFGDKSTQELNLISVPSIFYGSRIKKGTVDLKFYITGTLIGQLKDVNRNGELIQTAPAGVNSGSVAGVVLYNEGFLLLTGSWNLDTTKKNYINDPSLTKNSKWIYWGSGINGFDNVALEDVYNSIEFQGETHVPTITMYAHAPKGELNHSNNPTFLDSGQYIYPTGSSTTSSIYRENYNATIKNTVFSPYDNTEMPFEKHTYISKVVIYDEDMNILGVAKVAKPVKKTEDREFSFKLKLDI